MTHRRSCRRSRCLRTNMASGLLTTEEGYTAVTIEGICREADVGRSTAPSEMRAGQRRTCARLSILASSYDPALLSGAEDNMARAADVLFEMRGGESRRAALLR